MVETSVSGHESQKGGWVATGSSEEDQESKCLILAFCFSHSGHGTGSEQVGLSANRAPRDSRSVRCTESRSCRLPFHRCCEEIERDVISGKMGQERSVRSVSSKRKRSSPSSLSCARVWLAVLTTISLAYDQATPGAQPTSLSRPFASKSWTRLTGSARASPSLVRQRIREGWGGDEAPTAGLSNG